VPKLKLPETFRAMGVDVVVAGGNSRELVEVMELFEAWDGVFSRFRPESELSRINAAASDFVVVSPLFGRALATSLDAAAATQGLVDPTLGAAIVAAGYDRDFAALCDDGLPLEPPAPGRWKAVRLSGRLLLRPAGLELDLNGVVKSLAVDEALGLLAGPGFVSAGGDIAARGPITVALPANGAVRLLGGGLATSGTRSRHWRRGGEEQHHLIDPRSGRPSRSRWSDVTVAAATCVAADVAAKAAFLLGDDGPAWLEELRLPGRFVAREGIHVNSKWAQLDCEARCL
jgi:thiamine biosynthesis lipoprotein